MIMYDQIWIYLIMYDFCRGYDNLDMVQCIKCNHCVWMVLFDCLNGKDLGLFDWFVFVFWCFQYIIKIWINVWIKYEYLKISYMNILQKKQYINCFVQKCMNNFVKMYE